MPEYIKFTKQNSGVVIDAAFIDKLMPDANGTFVKVYLLALMYAGSGVTASNAQLAEKLGILESDVVQAFTYWCEVGAVTISDGEVTFVPIDAAQTRAEKTSSDKAHTSAGVMKKPDIGTAADALAADKALADMCSTAQLVLGKTLTAADTSTLYWFYDSLGFSPETIMMLLEYCVSKEKRNMNYIEKIAISWHEQGIKTMAQADAYIKRENDKGGYLNVIRKIMGITDRAFSRSEEQFLYKWRDEYGMSEDMVALAYEYCVIQISKVSFPYMDKIMARWNENNIRTVAQAEADNESFKRSAGAQQRGGYHNQQPEVFRDNMNHEELEKMVWKKLGNQ